MFAVLLAALTVTVGDSTTYKDLDIDEVVIVSSRSEGRKRSVKGQTASIDEHLSELNNVNLIRRGSYAWEPVVNNMQTERLSTTIDGMKIFYACTDKMDPVTSYVESGNLQSISLNSGLDGNPQATGNIGGALDLKLRKVGFDALLNHETESLRNWEANASAGHEFNGHVQVYGADGAFSGSRFYANAGAFFRKADNYDAADGEEVEFSQFQKVNVFTNLGFRLNRAHSLEATFIYDLATDIGYPALNMDVKEAEAIISSVSHKWNIPANEATLLWREGGVLETKLYYNHITHEMDDTHRPDVEIHMDMPGESWTAGLYSLLRVNVGRHEVVANYDLYYNRLFADMTMYPGGAAPMYMVTWPDVGTLNTGVALSDYVTFRHKQTLKVSAKVAYQTQKLNSEEGYSALKVFFPYMEDSYYQTTARVSATYGWRPGDWQISVGAGWGSRAPTVTEAYGYYLNNTFDKYDYIGNPHLKNESAVELNGSIRWNLFALGRARSPISFRADANVFLFSNYIIGQFEDRLSAMTVDAEGVKVYNNLDDTKILNTSLSVDWQIFKWLKTSNKFSYAVGRDDEGDNLPFISPFAYQNSLDFGVKRFSADVTVRGNGRQRDFGEKYGETETAEFAILNVGAQYSFTLSKSVLTWRVGVENVFDKEYTTYSDWNKIAQKGRNFYVNINILL